MRQYATYGSASLNGEIRDAIPADVLYPPAPDLSFYAVVPMSAPTLSGALNQTAQEAAAKPWSFKSSPLPWLVIGLVVGVGALKFIHWG